MVFEIGNTSLSTEEPNLTDVVIQTDLSEMHFNLVLSCFRTWDEKAEVTTSSILNL